MARPGEALAALTAQARESFAREAVATAAAVAAAEQGAALAQRRAAEELLGGRWEAATAALAHAQLMRAEGAFVMVSRWFGGIKLGPDRFRHVNNAARAAIVAHGGFEGAAPRVGKAGGQRGAARR